MARRKWQAPAIPGRRSGWDAAFAETMARHALIPFEYGRSDCLLVTADLCQAMTGVDPMKGLRRYDSELGANRLLASLGFEDVEAALAAVFPRLPAAGHAMRGDCGIIERLTGGKIIKSTVIVLDHRAFGKSDAGPVTVPTLVLKTVFAIGAR